MTCDMWCVTRCILWVRYEARCCVCAMVYTYTTHDTTRMEIDTNYTQSNAQLTTHNASHTAQHTVNKSHTTHKRVPQITHIKH